MLIKKKTPKGIFWIMLVAIFLLTGGHISASSAGVLPSDLIINEFVAANKTGLVDEDGDCSDWIEIYNRSDSPVNLAGWALTNDPNQPQQWPFPDITLGSKEYLVVFASGKNRRTVGEQGAILHTNFKLNKEGDFLALHNLLEGRLMDTISPQFPEQFRDVSYGRYGHNLSLGYLANPTPGQPNDETRYWAGAVAPVEFSMERGFYEAPFTVVLMTTPGATIRYTLDGSEPTERHGAIFTDPITIEGTTMLRAIAFRPNFLPSKVTTHTYIFPDDVVTQLETSPDLLANISTQTLKAEYGYNAVPAAVGYKAKPELADGSPTRDELTESLKSIPTISLVMASQSFADLKAEPQEIEKRVEHPISVELIDPDGNQQGFQINAGVKLQNIPKASESIAKRSLRLFFRGKYDGATRLEYPLFTDSPVESFDTLVLEAGSNIDLAGQDQANFIRNEWLRASQIEMSNLGAHGMFVHLYLNGEYWGLYNVTERPDADFMASYLGGLKEDWFIANQDGPVTDDLGPQADKLTDLFTVLPLLSRLDLGDTETGQSNEVIGVYSTAASYFDPATLIDVAILNWYTGWPIDNWYAAIRPQDQASRGKILIADEQQAVAVSSTAQTRQSLVNLLVQAAMEKPDFQMEFADRLYKHLYNNGALTDANAQARWMRLNNTVEPAFTAEAVRWVGSNDVPMPVIGGPLKMQNDDVLAQMADRPDAVIEVMREMGYYPSIDPPVFNHEGGLVESGFTLTMSAECSSCTIYYTTDGSDPRLPITGEIIPTAKTYNAPLVLTITTHIKTRLWNDAASADSGQKWSALHEATFSVVKEDNKLRLTEIMYNPVGGDDYEFVELQNTGNSSLNLANFSLDDGVRFTFLSNTLPLAAGEFAVLVSNPKAFAERYPDVAVSGMYEGHLSNKGETILLRDASGHVIIEVEYNDEYGWPVSADGRGDSLTLIDPAGIPSDPKNWRASLNLNGSPGATESITDLNRRAG